MKTDEISGEKDDERDERKDEYDRDTFWFAHTRVELSFEKIKISNFA